MRFLRFMTLCALAALSCVACEEEYTTYSDAEYVMFADTMSINMVLPDQEYFSVAVASTVACKYDRTFGVEIVDEGSNAIEGQHFRLLSNSVTIPAGKLATEVKVQGLYDNILPTDSLGFTLRLVMPEQLEWELYKDNVQTKVVMYKACPFDVNNFSGWCVVTSLLLRNYPGDNDSYQRLIKTEVHPSVPNTVILRECFYDGYDLTITFDTTDVANPIVTMDKDQLLSDEASVFGQILGDNHILTTHSSYYPSYYNSCQRFVELWNEVYVEDLGEMIGTVGHFYSILEWVSDEEAADLKKQGM
ncbi:MAG: DUF4984 domain-containing protein [Tidjanibacter sp.]|nr:DUF4984 domain-containing protein [Tidjanibacter sp.]MBR7102531.1 DUF4984 domain-containing protein [Tidjanibacter sp.]